MRAFTLAGIHALLAHVNAEECPPEPLSLLQSRVVDPRSTLRTDPASSSGAQNLLEKVRKLAHRRFNASTADEDVQALLDGVDAALTTFNQTIFQEYEGQRTAVSHAAALVRQRAEAAGQLDSAAVADLESRVEATEAAHADCQTRLGETQRDEREKCSLLQHHVDSHMSVCDPALAHGCDSTEDFWAVYDYWRGFIESQGATIASQRTACTDAHTVHLTQTSDCLAAEDSFRLAQSDWQAHTVRCENYDTEVGNFNEVLENANRQVGLLQRDHSTIALTRCIFDIIGATLNGEEPQRTIQSCETDETFEGAATAALRALEASIPGSAECGRAAPTAGVPVGGAVVHIDAMAQSGGHITASSQTLVRWERDTENCPHDLPIAGGQTLTSDVPHICENPRQLPHGGLPAWGSDLMDGKPGFRFWDEPAADHLKPILTAREGIIQNPTSYTFMVLKDMTARRYWSLWWSVGSRHKYDSDDHIRSFGTANRLFAYRDPTGRVDGCSWGNDGDGCPEATIGVPMNQVFVLSVIQDQENQHVRVVVDTENQRNQVIDYNPRNWREASEYGDEQPFFIFNSYSGQYGIDGVLGELIHYNARLTMEDFESVRDHLVEKWL